MSPLHTLLAILGALLWGFNFVAIKVGLAEFPPLLFAALRFFVVAFPAVLFVPRLGLAWRWIIAIGLAMGVFQFGLLYVGMAQGMPASLSSIVVQSQALFTLVFSAWWLRDHPQRRQWLGVGLALAGMGAIAWTRSNPTSLVGLCLVVGSAASWAVGNICIKLAHIDNGFRLLVWMAIIPPLPLLGLSFYFEAGQWAALRSLTPLGMGTILYTGLISSLLCFGFWAHLVQQYSPSRVAPFSLVEMAGTLLVFLGLCCATLSPVTKAETDSGKSAS